MKNILKGMLLMVILMTLPSCSGSGDYSSEKCAALNEKISNKEELTKNDYSEMVEQLGAIVYTFKDKEKEIGDDKDKLRDYSKTTEAKEMLNYFFAFGMYLDSHSEQLSNSDKRKINKLMEEFSKEKDKTKD